MDTPRVLIISDSFKGALSSAEAGDAIRAGTLRALPRSADVRVFPVADGGEGTVDAFLQATGGQRIAVEVTGPFPGETITAHYGMLEGTQTAVVEVAAAAGLPRAGARKNPELTTTYGVGELIRHAIEVSGACEVMIGAGGSATNDLACGAAAALGARFTDRAGDEFVPVGGTLTHVAAVDLTAVAALLDGVRLSVMCDIDNPLYGQNGAAQVFAPQKGADEQMVARLDAGLRHVADTVIAPTLGVDIAQRAGAGAAGGFAGGMVAFCQADLEPGITAVLNAIGFADHLTSTDGPVLVVTGEGQIDGQSLSGKVPVGVARAVTEAARHHGGAPATVVVLAGSVGDDIDAVYEQGATAVFGINPSPVDLPQALANTATNLTRTAENVVRLFFR